MLALWGVPTWSEDLAGRIRPKTHLHRLGRSRGDVRPPSSEDSKGWNPCAGMLHRPKTVLRNAPCDASCPFGPKTLRPSRVPEGSQAFSGKDARQISCGADLKTDICPRGDVSL
jgi:hypothetical protein